MKKNERQSGFTMLELLFVLVVMGALLSVIVPKAYRITIDAKYAILREICVELGTYAQEWSRASVASQEQELSTSDYDAYMASLAGNGSGTPTFPNSEWIAGSNVAGAAGTSNWNTRSGGRRGINGRVTDNPAVTTEPPENTVQDIVPPSKIPINPFNGTSVFIGATNDPASKGNAITGAIACGAVDIDGNGVGEEWHLYALTFQGTANSVGAVLQPHTAGSAAFHGGQDAGTLQGLKNGVFLAEER